MDESASAFIAKAEGSARKEPMNDAVLYYRKALRADTSEEVCDAVLDSFVACVEYTFRFESIHPTFGYLDHLLDDLLVMFPDRFSEKGPALVICDRLIGNIESLKGPLAISDVPDVCALICSCSLVGDPDIRRHRAAFDACAGYYRETLALLKRNKRSYRNGTEANRIIDMCADARDMMEDISDLIGKLTDGYPMASMDQVVDYWRQDCERRAVYMSVFDAGFQNWFMARFSPNRVEAGAAARECKAYVAAYIGAYMTADVGDFDTSSVRKEIESKMDSL